MTRVSAIKWQQRHRETARHGCSLAIRSGDEHGGGAGLFAKGEGGESDDCDVAEMVFFPESSGAEDRQISRLKRFTTH